MNTPLRTYEVRVKTKGGGKRFRYSLGIFVYDESIKMYHKDARTPEQAMRKCEKHGRPISARKVNLDKLDGDVSNLSLEEMLANPYRDAIAMDEMIWKKRNTRIQHKHRDKTLD